MLAPFFNLESGLTLENGGPTLPWGADRDALAETATFWQQRSHDSWLIFAWQKRTFLNGMRGDVTTELPDQPEAVMSALTLRPSSLLRGPHSMADEFHSLQNQLVDRFGPPSSFSSEDKNGEAVWQFDNICIRHSFWDGLGGDHSVLLFRDVI